MGAELGEEKWKAPLNNFVLFPDGLWDSLSFVMVFFYNFKTQASIFLTLKETFFFFISYMNWSSVLWSLVNFVQQIKVHHNSGFALVACCCFSRLTLDVFFIIGDWLFIFFLPFFAQFCFLVWNCQWGRLWKLSAMRKTSFDSRSVSGLPNSHCILPSNHQVEGVTGGYLCWEFFIPYWSFFGKINNNDKLLNILLCNVLNQHSL